MSHKPNNRSNPGRDRPGSQLTLGKYSQVPFSSPSMKYTLSSQTHLDSRMWGRSPHEGQGCAWMTGDANWSSDSQHRTTARSQGFVPYGGLRPQKIPYMLSSPVLLSLRVNRGGSFSSLCLLIRNTLFCLHHSLTAQFPCGAVAWKEKKFSFWFSFP